AHSLTHAWMHSSHVWIDEGLAQFMSVLWAERTAGHSAALSAMEEANRSLALIEPDRTAPGASEVTSAAGASLIDATGEAFYRTKAAAVFWMLRDLVGD